MIGKTKRTQYWLNIRLTWEDVCGIQYLALDYYVWADGRVVCSQARYNTDTSQKGKSNKGKLCMKNCTKWDVCFFCRGKLPEPLPVQIGCIHNSSICSWNIWSYLLSVERKICKGMYISFIYWCLHNVLTDDCILLITSTHVAVYGC